MGVLSKQPVSKFLIHKEQEAIIAQTKLEIYSSLEVYVKQNFSHNMQNWLNLTLGENIKFVDLNRRPNVVNYWPYFLMEISADSFFILAGRLKSIAVV